MEELKASCAVLGFKPVVPNFPNGLECVKPSQRAESGGQEYPGAWRDKVHELAEVFDAEQPDLILFPHAEDFHETHVGTNLLAIDALNAHLQRHRRQVMCAETEYWRPMEKPNLLVGVSAEVEAALVMAVAEHGGEVRRNAYHIHHPARLIDNARRGAEVVGGSGAPSCRFQFAELYRIFHITAGSAVVPGGGPPGPGRFCAGWGAERGIVIGPSEKLSLARLRELFPTGLS